MKHYYLMILYIIYYLAEIFTHTNISPMNSLPFTFSRGISFLHTCFLTMSRFIALPTKCSTKFLANSILHTINIYIQKKIIFKKLKKFWTLKNVTYSIYSLYLSIFHFSRLNLLFEI